MRNRIEQWYDALATECSDSEIAAGLQTGDIDTPEWMGKSEDTDHMKIWDTESGASSSWGFMSLDYEDEINE
jgi:hypothetical protein